MSPGNLANRLLANCKIGVFFSKLDHIFDVGQRKPLHAGESRFQIFCVIELYELEIGGLYFSETVKKNRGFDDGNDLMSNVLQFLMFSTNELARTNLFNIFSIVVSKGVNISR